MRNAEAYPKRETTKPWTVDAQARPRSHCRHPHPRSVRPDQAMPIRITPPSLSCPSVKNVSLGPPRSGLGHRRGSPAGCRVAGERKTGEGTRCRRIRFTRPPMRISHHASHLGFALYSRAMLQPSRPRLAVPQESAARVGPRDVGAPGRSVPVGRRATTAGSRRTGALCGLARTDKQHKRRRTINLSRPHFSHDGHESE